MVDRSGGTAQRLTTNAAREISPRFSPDGSQVAFARVNPAAGSFGWDVYVVSASGGEERRITYHPDLDFPVNWIGDGQRLLIVSFRHRTSPFGSRLYTVPVQGGFATEVPVPNGWQGSFSSGNEGYNAFNRQFYALLEKQGLIIDGRFNTGGRAADYVVDTLRRVPLMRAQLRDAEDIRIPTGIIEGPKVLLTNESAGSGGDSFPWTWQQSKIGPVVGTRTAGWGIGATEYELIDRGIVRVPDWGWYDPRTGTWFMENRGVTPDYELEIMPPAWRAGRDPQLEKAVELAMDALKKTKTPPIKRPSYPVYK